MKREKVIEMLEYIKYTGNGESEYRNCSQSVAIDIAIKALEQEPCEDAVSRRFMYELGATCIATRDKNGKLIALGAIENLPSVIPKGVTITDFADKCRQCGREKVLDKIRAEIAKEIISGDSIDYINGLNMALMIINEKRIGEEKGIEQI